MILYNTTTPFSSSGSGEVHVSLILTELIATTLKDSGGPLGANVKKNNYNKHITLYNIPSSKVWTDIVLLNGPCSTVTAETEITYT